MKRNKYIIINDVFPILFTEAQQHIDIGRKLNVTSAGFFRTSILEGKIKVHCYGESISLGIKSQPDDSYFIEKFLNMGE